MTRNTKEISLIQIRTGDLANLPKALHQSEFGLAKDVNRLFIGNASNTALANRTSDFPYQNLEVLTEYSDLKDYFKYSYENNIKTVDGENKRSDYKEYLPIVVNCMCENPTIPYACSIEINDAIVSFEKDDGLETIIDKINAVSEKTHTYATMMTGTQHLTFICFLSSLYVKDVDENTPVVNDILGFPSSYNANILMPVRKVTEKLDDFLNITDFGIVGDGITNNGEKIFNALIEVYKNFNDTQFYRNVLFPAGTYVFDSKKYDGTTSAFAYHPFPLVSNLMVHGEGIDRTVIKADSDFAQPLLNCIDDTLTVETNNAYGKHNNYPQNIVIEDMTFESSTDICNIASASNVTFNRVKFKSTASNTLVKIYGNETAHASNITFNECIFDGGDHGMDISKFAKNVNITNCKFINSNLQAIEIGKEATVYGVNLTSNSFNNCFTKAGNDKDNVIIKLFENAKYVSIHQSIFDENVIERTAINDDGVIILPYKDVNGKDGKNFIDTLDPNTDTNKILKFNFTQPQWEYIDYLCNQNGEIVFGVDKNDEDITASNGLNIVHTDDNITIKSVGSGDVIIAQDNDSDLILGKGTDGNSNGKIVLNKTLHVNNNIISNDNGESNIIFQPASDTYLEIDPNSLTNTPYEQTILGIDNAIPNVAYVENAASTSVFLKLNTEAIKSINKGNVILDIITFDKKTFGDNVYLKNISINVKHPFYQSYKLKSKAVDYNEGHTYYRGDIVKGLVSDSSEQYGVVLETHIADTIFYDALNNNKIKLLESTNNLNDICYIDIMATDGQDDVVSLTKKYHVDYTHIEEDNFEFSANISAINNFNLNPQEFDNSKIFGDANYLVKHQDKVFVVKKGEKDENENYPQLHLTALDLRDTTIATKKYSEGYNYIYDMDRTILMDNQPVELSAKNFSDMTLYVVFGNENGEPIYSFEDYNQLCPSGEAIIRIDYVKKEVK